MILRHGSNDTLGEPGGKGFHGLTLYCRLGIDVEDMGGAARAVSFSESQDRAVVQKFDLFDRTVDTIAVANGEVREAFVLFIPRRYLFPGLFLELLQSLLEVSNGLCILLLFLMVDPVSLPDGLNEGFGEAAEPNWVIDVESLDEVSGRCWGYRVSTGDRHEDGYGGARGTV